MDLISWRMQLWLVAAGYAAALVVSAGLVIPRYIYEIEHHDEVAAASGMFAGGDLLLAIFIAGLFLIPTCLLLWVSAKFESFYDRYSRILLVISLTAPLCLGLLFLGEKHLGSIINLICWYRLFWSPFVLMLTGFSRFAARSTRAKGFAS